MASFEARNEFDCSFASFSNRVRARKKERGKKWACLNFNIHGSILKGGFPAPSALFGPSSSLSAVGCESLVSSLYFDGGSWAVVCFHAEIVPRLREVIRPRKRKKLKTRSEEFLAESHRGWQPCDLALTAIMRKSSFRQKR